MVPPGTLNKWQTNLDETKNLGGTKLNVYQGDDQSGELAAKISGDLKQDILEDLYVNNQKELKDKDLRIEFLENEITKLKIDEIEFANLSKEVKLNYDKLKSFSYSKRVFANFSEVDTVPGTIDTIPVFEVEWDRRVSSRTKQENSEKLANWLKFKLDLDTLLIEEK
jgi:polyhydroxyalkanoate synthesis regulator phasin